MAPQKSPDDSLAERALPRPLLRALRHIFAQRLEGCMLAGGSALAGFYAGHRRSDDVDLFTKNATSQEAAVLAVRSLETIGARLAILTHSAQFFRAELELDGHSFKADVVLHEHLHEIGRSIKLQDDLMVADFDTLLMMKAAALVSRCSEKDLYDVLWILENGEGLTLEDMVARAQRLDGGATAEGLLISASGTEPREQSCDFALDPPLSGPEVYQRIKVFRSGLLKGLARLAEDQPAPPIAELLCRVRRLTKP